MIQIIQDESSSDSNSLSQLIHIKHAELPVVCSDHVPTSYTLCIVPSVLHYIHTFLYGLKQEIRKQFSSLHPSSES